MTNINILSPDVIAKIAAGEVVDRPASVVKELVENALDAGATSIEIYLKDAGKELIHIKDNGHGISPADLENIFQRHATSKITSIDDLESLGSMGFRGEALYSIAAVSDITLKSQSSVIPEKAGVPSEAWQIHVRGGIRQSLEPTAATTHGTEIKIAELFFNTPARRKFLKSTTAELNQILNVVLPYTLIYPEKRFLLNHGGRSLLDLKPAPSRPDRAAAALNITFKDLLETDQEFPQDEIRVQLLLGNINIQRARRDLQFIFINGRPVDSKTLSFNINDVYKLIMPPRVYGAFIVDIQINPAHVDVNIHPTKREVRLKDETKIVSLVRRMVEYQLMQYGSGKTVRDGGVAEGGGSLVARNDVRTTGETRGQAPDITRWSGNQGLPADQIIYGPGQLQGRFNDAALSQRNFSFNHELNFTHNESAPPPSDNFRQKFSSAHYLCQFMNKYLLFEAQETLMIVDQHAAQERIMFEKFKTQIETGKVEVQHLLTPLVLKLTPQEKLTWEEMQLTLHEVGIETNQFDEDSIAVQTQPVLLNNLQHTVRTLLGGDMAERCDHLTIARRACKASVVAGDKLLPPQALHQRQQLLSCHDPFICPHGRPTVIEISDGFLERQFLRT